MTIDLPLAQFVDSGTSDSITVCISSDPDERVRLVAALDPSVVVIMVPDRSTALALLAQPALPVPPALPPADQPHASQRPRSTHNPVPAQRTSAESFRGTREPAPDLPRTKLVLDELVVDRDRAMVSWAGRPIALTHLEIEVLTCLMSDAGRVWSHERLHVAAWGSRYLGDRDCVHSLVKRLRRKLREAGVALEVRAVRGVGFQLVSVT